VYFYIIFISDTPSFVRLFIDVDVQYMTFVTSRIPP